MFQPAIANRQPAAAARAAAPPATDSAAAAAHLLPQLAFKAYSPIPLE